jgi:hypothetical protein
MADSVLEWNVDEKWKNLAVCGRDGLHPKSMTAREVREIRKRGRGICD